MWLIFLIFSISCVVIIPTIMALVDRIKPVKNHKFKLLTMLFVGVLVSAIFMFFPMHMSEEGVASMNAFRALLLSVFNSVQIFTAGCEVSAVRDGLQNCAPQLLTAYQIWSSVLLVAAPILTFGFVLSVFKKISAYTRYIFSYFKEVYVFSELNDKSLILANDIVKREGKKAVIVFTDVFEENKETSYELIEEAKKLRAICFKNDILVVKFKNHSKNKPISFFTIGVDETENLNQALKLIERYRDRENSNIYVFSTKIESGILLSSTDKGKMRVRRINEVQSLINHLLYEKGELIFQTKKAVSSKDKDISAVILGMGKHGTEMVKALSWYGQMDGYNLEVNAYDRDPLAEEKFTALAPELMSSKYNGRKIEGDAQYKITVHSGIDTDTITFANKIKKVKNVTYALVALGDDDVNIRTAINLRMYFERMGVNPVIQAIVYNSQQKKALEGIKNFAGQGYNIMFIGDLETSYVWKVIIDSELEAKALAHHKSYVEGLLKDDERYQKLLYCYLDDEKITVEELRERIATSKSTKKAKGSSLEEQSPVEGKEFYYVLKEYAEEKFWKYEYNYRSSVATAVHRKAKETCGILKADTDSSKLTQQEKIAIEILENKRWNAYTRAEGYIYSGSRDESSRNDLAKMHHCLVKYDLLTPLEKMRNSEVGSTATKNNKDTKKR